MAACFDLILSASQHCFLKRAVTGELTCGLACYLQLQFRRLAEALSKVTNNKSSSGKRRKKGYSVCDSCDPGEGQERETNTM